MREEDLKIDTYRSGAGINAYPNAGSVAVRVTHLPSGMSEQCSEHRGQFHNRKQAEEALRVRVEAWELENEQTSQ